MNIGWKSSTTAMINHLKLRHNILIPKSGLSKNYGVNNVPKIKKKKETSTYLEFVKKE